MANKKRNSYFGKKTAEAGSYILTTAERELTATVAVEALTAGELTLYVEFLVP